MSSRPKRQKGKPDEEEAQPVMSFNPLSTSGLGEWADLDSAPGLLGSSMGFFESALGSEILPLATGGTDLAAAAAAHSGTPSIAPASSSSSSSSAPASLSPSRPLPGLGCVTQSAVAQLVPDGVPGIGPDPLAASQRGAMCLQAYRSHVFSMEEAVRNVGAMQQAARPPLAPADLNNLLVQHNNLRASIEAVMLDMYRFTCSIITDPAQQMELMDLQHRLQANARQLELLAAELNFWANPTLARSPLAFAALVMSKHQFPRTVFKDKKLAEVIEVRLLCTAQAQARVLSPVRCYVVTEDQQVKGAASKRYPLKPIHTAQIDELGIARFVDLVFAQGTSVRKVKLQYEAEVEVTDLSTSPPTVFSSTTLYSDYSEPIIVMTHRSQWEEAEGAMLKYDAFRGVNSEKLVKISWPSFANALQRHFYRITSSQRALASRDLAFLHTKLNCSEEVSQNDADLFWGWSCKTSKQIHLQKNCPLWQRGYFFGFITKQQATELLAPLPNGSFLLRFSEKNAGQFAIAFVKNRRVEHYLLKPDDQNKNMTEFLEPHDTCTSIVRAMPDGLAVSYELVSKAAMIEEFTNPKGKKRTGSIVSTDGYAPEL